MNKFLYQPVKPFIVGQTYGENKACVDLKTGVKVIACDGLNPPSGFKSLYGPQGHKGIDVRAYHGQEVYCAQRGVVGGVDTNPRSGLDVRIETVIEGKKYRHIYEHLLGYQPRLGDKIETGQLIGWADNTGFSAGDHLHFELQEWRNGNWISIDPIPVMEAKFAKDILAINNTIKYLYEQVALLTDNLANWLRQT